ncbi:MAG: arylsulfatase [Burkholderiales bacterium]|nr:arylsulfatase [Burkholderiales bacterium]
MLRLIVLRHPACAGPLARVLVQLLAAVLFAGVAAAAQRPHVVLVLADDLGWNDVGFHGGEARTPSIDRLAAGGAALNTFYVLPSSSQTRAALLTGRHPMRYGLQTGDILPATRYGLPEDEPTLAAALKRSGYRTAFIGRWQLGHASAQWLPTRRGFDSFYGSLAGQVGARLAKGGGSDWRRDDKPASDRGSVTTLLTREAVAMIGKHDVATPLFLVLAYSLPAQSADADRSALARVASVADSARRAHLAAVATLDAAVGEVVAALEKRGMLQDTLLVFHSDNGGGVATRYPTGESEGLTTGADNGVFREGRGSLYEGGVRSFAVAHWPQAIRPKTVIADMLHVTDLAPTVMALAGAAADAKRKPDGVDILSVLGGTERSAHKELLLAVEDFRGAVRVGEWKLVVHAALPSRIELFDVANDPEESENKAATYPERVKELLERLNAYAYEMAPAKYLEEAPGVAALLRRHNPAQP